MSDMRTWHKFPPKSRFFQMLAFSRIYEVPIIVIGITTDHCKIRTILKSRCHTISLFDKE